MKRKLAMLATAMMILALAAPAWAEFVDFTAGVTSYSGLTITAKTMANINNSPFTTGTAENVYWGDLGNMDVAGKSYFGLGVVKKSETPSITTGPIMKFEALVFTLAQTQNVANVSFTMLGLNALTSGGTGFPADSARVFFLLASGQVISVDINAGAIKADTWQYSFDWAFNQAGITDKRITALAVEQIYGNTTYGATPDNIRKFGVGSITYDAPAPVAEPLTLLLLGAGLIGLAGMRRFRK